MLRSGSRRVTPVAASGGTGTCSMPVDRWCATGADERVSREGPTDGVAQHGVATGPVAKALAVRPVSVRPLEGGERGCLHG
jgi:hypothetical protein